MDAGQTANATETGSAASSEPIAVTNGGRSARANASEPSRATTAAKKHVILFLAANPDGTDRLALDREARSIHVELKRTGYRDRFDFVTRWAAEPLDLLRELRELRPTIVERDRREQCFASPYPDYPDLGYYTLTYAWIPTKRASICMNAGRSLI